MQSKATIDALEALNRLARHFEVKPDDAPDVAEYKSAMTDGFDSLRRSLRSPRKADRKKRMVPHRNNARFFEFFPASCHGHGVTGNGFVVI
ncbi:MAG: hypothetical protein ACYCQL_03690 [Acidithiobacillus sp.]